jgi:hypothetical protein
MGLGLGGETMAFTHKSSDGRGLTEGTRREYNLAMLDFILEDWMPWYWFLRDYSVMDVNRCSSCRICNL